MALVTVTGGTPGETVTVPFNAAGNLALAQRVASLISAGISGGTLTPATSSAGQPAPLPPGATGVMFQDAPGFSFLPPGYANAVNSADGPVSIFGSGDPNEMILSGNSGMTFIAPDGSGTIVAGSGANEVALFPQDRGSWSIAMAGHDRVLALGAGHDTIDATGATTTVVRGGNGSDITFIGGAGAATLQAGNGNETLSAVGSPGHATIVGGAGTDVFNFIKGQAAGTDVVFNFHGKDQIGLSGYGADAVTAALATQTVARGGVTITLSDKTTITFSDLSHLTRANFV